MKGEENGSRFQNKLWIGMVAIGGLVLAGSALPQAVAQQAQPQRTQQPAAPAARGGPMTRQQVAERLNLVPVFAIVSRDGTPILANVDQDGKKVQLASFWLDQNQANETIKQIKSTSPEIGAQAQVIPMSLGYAYEISEQERARNSGIVFQVLPRESDVRQALSIVQQTQKDIKEFPGVPLFYGMADQGVFTIEKDGVEVVPFFFDQNDLKNSLQRAGASNPEVVKRIKIEVTTLDRVVASMMASDAKPDVQKIAFVPARSALEYVRSLRPPQAAPQQGQPPQPAPRRSP